MTRDQLTWTHDVCIREETYKSALALIVNARHRLPFSRVWGSGSTSGSDGQFFRGAKRGASGGDINFHYGVDHDFSFYTHNSDHRAPFHINVISAATNPVGPGLIDAKYTSPLHAYDASQIDSEAHPVADPLARPEPTGFGPVAGE